MSSECRVCGVCLVVGENVPQYQIDHGDYICRECHLKHRREYERKYRILNRERRREYQQKYRVGYPECTREHQREYRHRTRRNQSMSENRACSQFLGVHVAERVLSQVFKNVERMLINNHGYDFICGKGHKIDVKSSCRSSCGAFADRWIFHIDKNQIADYFLLLAFDNRDDLNPEHIWIIPAGEINDHISISVSETRTDKWNEYRLDIDKVITCCNAMKEGDI